MYTHTTNVENEGFISVISVITAYSYRNRLKHFCRKNCVGFFNESEVLRLLSRKNGILICDIVGKVLIG
jgi:hypothetical protein